MSYVLASLSKRCGSNKQTMNTTSIFSQKSPVETGIYIKADFKKQQSYKYDVKNAAADKLQVEKEEAIVKSIFQTSVTNKSITGNHKYTIVQGDDKRLNKDGVLRVYKMTEPIDIPVRRLLGNWKKSYIGVTLIVANGQWCVEGDSVDIKPVPIALAALQSIWKFALA